MTARVALSDPQAPIERTFDEDTGRWVYAAREPYADDVHCRLMTLVTKPEEADAGESVDIVAGYMLAVPLDTPGLAIGHHAIVSHTGDALLDGRQLRVDEVIFGSLLAERRMRCSLTN